MASSRIRRRQKLVDARFQFQLGTHLVGWLYLYVVVVAVAVNLPALKALLFADGDDARFVEAMHAVRSFSSFVLVPLVLTFLVMAVHAILLTHRIAGPIFRVKAALGEIAQRRFPESVTFRDRDFLKDVAEELTATSQALREDQERMRRMNAETKAAAQRLVELARTGIEREHLVVVATDVLAATERLERHLAVDADPDADAPEGDGDAVLERIASLDV